MTIDQLLRWAVAELKAIDTAPLDAQVLLAFVLEESRTHLMAWPEKEVSDSLEQAFRQLVAERKTHRPIAHLTGEREFWSLPLYTNDTTLIPRPDTERLVEIALEKLPKSQIDLIDLGTGTGAIALALGTERPLWRIAAVDQSPEAIKLAQRNAKRHHLTGIDFRVNNWLDDFDREKFDAVLSNPPYIRSDDPHLNQGDVQFEPHSALVAEDDGIQDIRLIAQQAQRCLKPGGWLMLEHGYDQRDEVGFELLHLGYTDIENFSDYGGQPRVTVGRKSAKIVSIR